MSGRQRHLLVDTMGLVLKPLVHAASVTDRLGGQHLLQAIDHVAQTVPRLRHLGVESAYQGRFVDWGQQTLGGTVALVQRPSRWRWLPADQEPPEVPAGLPVLPRRWVVERTVGWLGRWRRTRTAYDDFPATAECVISLTMIRLMLRRLAQS